MLSKNGSVRIASTATISHETRRVPTSCQVQPMPSAIASTLSAIHADDAASSESAPNGARAKAVHGGYARRTPQRSFAIVLFVTVFGLANIYVKALNRVKGRA